MGRGKRAESGGSVWGRVQRAVQPVWLFARKHKVVVIPAGAGVLVLAAALIVFFGFGGAPEELPEPSPEPSPVVVSPSPEPSPSPSPEPPPSPEPSPVDFTANPLTGLPLANEDAQGGRPIAVVHNNSYNPGGRQHALPMYGIGQADIIYEVMAEGNITRMLAFYQEMDDIPKIGAVRSTRTYYVELALAYDAVLVHVGGSPQALRDIPNWGVSNINAMNQPATHFWRDYSDRPQSSSEHTLFTSSERLTEIYEKIPRQTVAEGFDNGLRFSDGLRIDGEPAESVRVPFSNSKSTTFDFDADDGLYYVGQYGAPFIDGADGEQIAVTNVLVVQTTIRVIDSEGRLSVDLQSGGHGYYVTGGQAVPVTWSRDAHNAPFRYFGAGGEPLEVFPGKTFVCVIPTNQTPVFE
ncbi:MAG: DUF3048 domain-containing protein [Oscillospiraceae bacterium]|nr:DUF3048 domain-containing protein [Oscillospiraceae bacterium]